MSKGYQGHRQYHPRAGDGIEDASIELTGDDPNWEAPPHSHEPFRARGTINLTEGYEQRMAALSEHEHGQALESTAVRVRNQMIRERDRKIAELEKLMEATRNKLRVLGIIK